MSNSNILSKNFLLLCLSSFLFFASFNMLIPELPDYISAMGGASYKGLIIGLFTITAGISRPFSGRLTDRWGRVPVMLAGSLVCVACGLLYPLANTIFLFLALRFFHGFSTGFKPTGTAAYVADIVPYQRRGEAMGLYGFVTSMGMAFGPFIGSWFAQYMSMNFLFLLSSAFAFISAIILYNLKETLSADRREGFSLNLFVLNKKDLFYINAWPVAVVTFLTTFSYGIVITLSPDLSKIIGLNNKGTYFLIFTLASLLARIFGGRISDKIGRIKVLIFGCVLLILAMFITSMVSEWSYVLGAILFGVSWGVTSPTLQAWAVDKATDETRGRAIATMYISLEAGIGLGAVLPMLLYNNNPELIHLAFWSGSAMAMFASSFLIWFLMRRSRIS